MTAQATKLAVRRCLQATKRAHVRTLVRVGATLAVVACMKYVLVLKQTIEADDVIPILTVLASVWMHLVWEMPRSRRSVKLWSKLN